MLARIPDEKIRTLRILHSSQYETYELEFCKAQLEADQKKVKELFEEIERELLEGYETIDGSKALWFKESIENQPVEIYSLWQALKERWGVK